QLGGDAEQFQLGWLQHRHATERPCPARNDGIPARGPCRLALAPARVTALALAVEMRKPLVGVLFCDLHLPALSWARHACNMLQIRPTFIGSNTWMSDSMFDADASTSLDWEKQPVLLWRRGPRLGCLPNGCEPHFRLRTSRVCARAIRL